MRPPKYEAIDTTGVPYTRTAKVVGELPDTATREAALEQATLSIAARIRLPAQRRIPFGAPVHIAFGMTRPQAKQHPAKDILLTHGHDVSLDYCLAYTSVTHSTRPRPHE